MGRSHLTSLERLDSLPSHSNALRLINKPYQREIQGEGHDSDLHDDMSALRRHSIQGEARRTIQVRKVRLAVVIQDSFRPWLLSSASREGHAHTEI